MGLPLVENVQKQFLMDLRTFINSVYPH